MLCASVNSIVEGNVSLKDAIDRQNAVVGGTEIATVSSLCRSAACLTPDDVHPEGRPPQLILASPPYPGVHVLYHRWQVHGRRETPAAFWIADCNDGHPTSHYTLGDRSSKGIDDYFDNITKAFSSVAALSDQRTIFVQLIAFQNTEHMERYLWAMNACGLTEFFLLPRHASADRRIWRTVPNRRWYADVSESQSGSKHEVVMLFRKR